jgi:tetratricopeptide (TPR) repeat protein
MPGDLDGRAAMWRDRMAGQRALLILDNAASSEQVAPLLPGTSGCMVLVTSRRYLGDLPAAAVSVQLDTLSPDEAAQVFVQLAPRAASEPAKVAELVALSGHLPLAIVLLARLATKHPSWNMADLIGQANAKLLTVTTESRTVAAAFDLSYTYLSDAQQRFFRHLGLHPGVVISPHAAAALTGLALGDATEQLDQLHGDRLLAEPLCQRYRMHDLIREYARRLAEGDSAEERERAVGRLVDYYLHAAFAAERRINPGRDPIILADAQAGVPAQRFTSDEEAWQWFTAEHASLLAVIEHADRQRLDAHAWQLPWAMATFLDRRGHWQDLLTTHQTALAAAERIGDQAAQARTHRLLSHAFLLLRQPDSAFGHLEQAIVAWRDLGDRAGEATAHHGFSLACQEQGNHERAITHASQALGLYRAAGHRIGEANALNTLGASYLWLNDYQRAVDHCRESLQLFCALGDRVGQASALESLGDIARHDDHSAQAVAYYQRAAILRQELGDHYLEAVALDRLGDIYHSSGNQAAAADAWQRALTILSELVHPDAAQIREKLRTSRRPPTA